MKDEIVKAYLAGLWDGDGSFGIAKRVHRIEAYQPFALITLTSSKHEKIWDLLEQTFGFKCVHERYNPKSSNWKTSYRWLLSSQKASEFAEAIEPYLIIKKERAQLLIGWPRKYYPKQNKEERELITNEQKRRYERMKVLNKRGAL